MKKQEQLNLQQLSKLVGHFIRYWGFRNIHGEIWTIVYLAPQPPSGIEIGKMLNVSKALISPALKELEQEGLIFQTQSENSKTKRYRAEEDVTKIIRNVLIRREKPMIDKIQQSFLSLKQSPHDGETLNANRLQNLGAMIDMAQMALATLIDTDQMWA